MTGERPTRKFVGRYYHDHTWWSITIDAYDFDDAQARVNKLGYLILDGELISTGPAFLLPFVRAYCWFRNLWRD